MGPQHDDDGSSIFWPGYVDATTNLVLNLLFLLTIMIVAVFMFALELGRMSEVVHTEKEAVEAAAAQSRPEIDVDAARKALEENPVLKAELRRVRAELARIRKAARRHAKARPRPVPRPEVIDATAGIEAPSAGGLDKAVAGGLGVTVRFREGAITLKPEERRRLFRVLAPLVRKGGRIRVSVVVPAGFTASRRMGFYRVMAVRNLLLEMKVPRKNIEVAVLERKKGGDAALVDIRPRP
jgi:hypothetical protein